MNECDAVLVGDPDFETDPLSKEIEILLESMWRVELSSPHDPVSVFPELE